MRDAGGLLGGFALTTIVIADWLKCIRSHDLLIRILTKL